MMLIGLIFPFSETLLSMLNLARSPTCIVVWIVLTELLG